MKATKLTMDREDEMLAFNFYYAGKHYHVGTIHLPSPSDAEIALKKIKRQKRSVK